MSRGDSNIARLRLRAGLTLMLAVVIASLHWIPYPGFAPWLALVVVHYWGVQAPEELPLTVVVCGGMIRDLYARGELLSISTIGMVIFYYAVIVQRRTLVKQPFMVIWLNFAVMLFLLYLALSEMMRTTPTWATEKIVFDVVVTIVIYPFLFLGFSKIRQPYAGSQHGHT